MSSHSDSLKSGARLPLFKEGQEWSLANFNRLVKAINSLLNLQVIRGNRDNFEVTDEKAILTIGPEQ